MFSKSNSPETEPLIQQHFSSGVNQNSNDTQLTSLGHSDYYNQSDCGATSVPITTAKQQSSEQSQQYGTSNPFLINENYYNVKNPNRLTICCREYKIFSLICVGIVILFSIVFVSFHSQIVNLFNGNNENINHHNEQNLYSLYEETWTQIEHIEDKYIPTHKWEYHSECDDSHLFDMTIAVKQQNTDKIGAELLKVSDPKSETYGEHWTMEEIHNFLAPHEESMDAIHAWLGYYGFDINNDLEYLTSNKDFIKLQVSCEIGNRMLNTQFSLWKQLSNSMLNEEKTTTTTKYHLRVKDHYHVPTIVSDHIDFISPTLRFPVRHHTNKIEIIEGITDKEGVDKDDLEAISSDSMFSYVTPQKLYDLYHMEDYLNSTAEKSPNSQAVASFIQEWFNDDDLGKFRSYFDIPLSSVTRVPSSQPSGYGDEAELDVQYIVSTGREIKTLVWDIEDDLYFITLVQQIAASLHPPSVVSMSYGGDEQSNGWGYCNRASIEFSKVGLNGVTFFASSGDEGAIGSSDECGEDDEYLPSFPASSPYVTAVGGTVYGMETTSLDSNTKEEGWFNSGGGFSVFFDREVWQDIAIAHYFDTVSALPAANRYNRGGRGYPDISAQSVAYIICVELTLWSVSGTSCSCPSVAGMFAVIDDLRLQNGKKRLGWLNPLLYTIYEEDQSYYFNDVITGYNEGCSDEGSIAFYCNSGWDPVTGVGTPKFPRLVDALVNS